MSRLRNAFVTGLLILVPVALTLHLLNWFFQVIESTLHSYLPSGFVPFDFPGLRFAMALLLVLLVGALTQNYFGKLVVATFDALMRRVTLVGGIYSGIKKFLETIFHPGSDRFSGAVLVQFPRTGVYSIGFRTGTPDWKLLQRRPGEKLVNVFVPCTPNPTSGFYLLVPEAEIVPLDMTVQEAFRVVISMGIVTSEEKPK